MFMTKKNASVNCIDVHMNRHEAETQTDHPELLLRGIGAGRM